MNYIIGKVTHIIFRNEISGYTVGVLKIKETDLSVTNTTLNFVGSFPQIKEKETHKFIGEYNNHTKYGKQFVVETTENILPTQKDELVEYLSSDIFPIGIKTAQKIVERFTSETIETIKNDPDALTQIKGISLAKAKKIHEKMLQYDATNQIALDLGKLGFTTTETFTIIKHYDTRALEKVNENIYEVGEKLELPFNTIDQIALQGLKIEATDQRRIQSTITHIISEMTFNTGDTYVSLEDLIKNLLLTIPTLNEDDIEYNLLYLEKKQKININEKEIQLKKFYEAEKNISSRVAHLLTQKTKPQKNINTQINYLEIKNKITYDTSQKDAILGALNNNIIIITGGPGTGKTTIVKAIIYLLKELYKASNEEIALLAPTGRASKRLTESTNLPAQTIHRYLGWDKDTGHFEANINNPNKEKYIIVDESSMIDTILLSSLFDGTKKDAKYIFVGDHHQLPSVGEGQILRDLIASQTIKVVKLNCLYRQNEGSYIIDLADEIRNKNLNPHFTTIKDDYNFIECPSDYISGVITTVIQKALSKGFKKEDIQILAPMYKTICGIDNLNKQTQSIMNPPSPHKNEVTTGDITYREGDRVLQLVNDSDKIIYNGDLGYIKTIHKTTKTTEITIDYDGNTITYTPKDYPNFTHGYAISIHKSQGGEFPIVIIPFSKSFKRMLYNKLVYTAVTRAKKTLILVGDKEAFIYGVNNNYGNRKTNLKEQLKSIKK